MTQVSQVLLIEVDEGSEQLLAELGRRGLEPRRYQRSLLVGLEDDTTYDIVRDAIADLALPLNRLEQRRRRVEELFADDQDQDSPRAPASVSGSGTAGNGGTAGPGGTSDTPEASHVR